MTVSNNTKEVLDSLVDVFAVVASDNAKKWTPSMFINQAAAWQLSFAKLVSKEGKSADEALRALLATTPVHDDEKTDDALVQIFLILCKGNTQLKGESELWQTWLAKGRKFAAKMLENEQPAASERPQQPKPKHTAKKPVDAASDADVDEALDDEPRGIRGKLAVFAGSAPATNNKKDEVMV